MRKLNTAELVIILLTAVVLSLMAGWALGARHSRQPLRVAASAVETASPPPASEPLPTPPPEETAPEPSKPSGPLDLNTAALEELMELPGIGEVRAQAILDWREEHGPFQHPEDLIQVPGIGEKTVESLMESVTVKGN